MVGANRTAGLEVAGQLSVLADGAPLEVTFRGDGIDVHVPDLVTAMKVRRTLKTARKGDRMRSVQNALARAGLELRFFIGGRRFGRLSSASRRGWLAALLGVAPMEVSAGAFLGSLRDAAGGRSVGP